jgi:lipopolysaccharide biosynthesis protein
MGKGFTRFCSKIPILKRIANTILLADEIEKQYLNDDISKLGTILDYSKYPSVTLNSQGNISNVDIILSTNDEFTGLKVALIAHFDEQSIIDPYVLYYAKHLKILGYSIILCSENSVNPNGISDGIFNAIVQRKNTGYDFASWKAAFTAFPSLYKASEILLTNDSIFGPIGDLMPLFDSMIPLKCDFWGIVESKSIRAHLQSYFLVLYPKSLENPAFKEFLESIGTSKIYKDSVFLETIFTKWLTEHDLRAAVRFPANNSYYDYVNPSVYGAENLLKTGYFPFIKRRLLYKSKYMSPPIKDLTTILSSKGYPIELIVNYAQRLKLQLRFKLPNGNKKAANG